MAIDGHKPRSVTVEGQAEDPGISRIDQPQPDPLSRADGKRFRSSPVDRRGIAEATAMPKLRIALDSTAQDDDALIEALAELEAEPDVQFGQRREHSG